MFKDDYWRYLATEKTLSDQYLTFHGKLVQVRQEVVDDPILVPKPVNGGHEVIGQAVVQPNVG